MSDASSQQRAPGIVWLLGALAGFAVLSMVLNGAFSGERVNARDTVRAANRADIDKVNTESLTKLGLLKGKSDDTLAKGLAMVKSQAQTVSTMVVPGSPTQLKAAAAPAPAAATTPSTAPAPAAPAPAAPAK